jgi:ACS family pantothenate transporter-like MFS transporter
MCLVCRLKSFNKKGHPPVYTVGQINTYPLGIYALQVRHYTLLTPNHLLTYFNVYKIITTLCYAWWSDAIGSRWPPIVFAGVST